ncbi:MFS transporter [Mesorhizobium sp. RP14(2022)]|uniref:MFS transporter n=1 Tax=Mesorhizobium liriopis TaxID=2953882 RepID=A0ABT1CCD4_9HYPH|nr:MFS transporter [Mesorhizobium liriopis]MCO6051841.1 MFS transporter [Mesorhizobium liriopis]
MPAQRIPAQSIPAQSTPARLVFLITVALAVGSFGIGTGEFAIMGLLPDVAKGLGVSVPQAGHLISAYAFGVVVGAPLIALLAAKLSHRTLLLFLMLAFAAGNLASAVAPGMESLVLLRFISGLPHGAYFGVAALVAASIARPNKRAQAIGRVMLGLTVATLLGTPLTTWLGQLFGWRSLFVLVGAIGVLTVALLWFTVPEDEVHEDASAMRELSALMRPQVWLTFAFAAVGFGGMFAVFSYIAATAQIVTGLPETFVPVILAIFGAGMISGNILGAWAADRALKETLFGMMVFNIVVLVVFALTAQYPIMLCLCVFFVGFGVALGPAVQARLMDVAGDAQTLAATSMHSAFNIANAAGAWLGGMAITAGYGYASTGWVGAILGVAGLAVLGISLLVDRPEAQPAS